jgi:hypothetical protein
MARNYMYTYGGHTWRSWDAFDIGVYEMFMNANSGCNVYQINSKRSSMPVLPVVRKLMLEVIQTSINTSGYRLNEYDGK